MCKKYPSFLWFKIVPSQGAHMHWGWWVFPIVNFDTKHLFLYNDRSTHSHNKCWYLYFHSLWNFYSCQNANMINSASDTSILRTWLVNHKMHLSINVHRVWGNNFVAPHCSQMILHTFLFYISKIHFWCYVTSNYFVGNIPFSIDFDRTVMTYPTLRRLYCINYILHQILNSCYIIDLISLYSVGKIFILFVSLKLKKFFMIHGFEFRYTPLN